MLWILFSLLLAVGLVSVWLLLGVVRRLLFRRRALRACTTFAGRCETLQNQFFEIASTSGKPRGLAWKQCTYHDPPLFAVDRATGEIYALLGVTIQFEAIEGGGMEDVEAVGNLRCATAVFVYRGGQWASDGRAVFNLEPPETLTRYQESLTPLKPDTLGVAAA